MTANNDPVRSERLFNDDSGSEIWCPNTGELVSSTLAGPPDFCPHCGDINHLDTTTATAAASLPRPEVAPGPENPVVYDDFDWARDERHMFQALGIKVPTCQAVTGGYTCTRPRGHTGPHAAGTGDAVAAVWDDTAAGTGDGAT